MQYDSSVLTKRSMAEIGGDAESKEWKSSRPASRGALKGAVAGRGALAEGGESKDHHREH